MIRPSASARILSPLAALASAAAFIACAVTTASAAPPQLYWDDGTVTVNGASGGGPGTWAVGGSGWEDGYSAVNWADGNNAVLGGTPGTVTLGGPITASSVTLDVDGYTITGQTLRLGAGGITANGDTTIASNLALGASQTWTVAAGKTLALTSNTRMSINGSCILDLNYSAGGTVSFQGTGAFSVGDQSPGTFNHNDGTIEITTTSAGFGLGLNIGYKIGGHGTYNLSGGTLNSRDSYVLLGAGGANTGTWNVSGGEANVRGIGFTSSTSATGTFALTGGRVNIGAYGIAAVTAGTRNINLGGGTLGALADWASSEAMTFSNPYRNVTFDTLDAADLTTPRTITLNGALGGSGGLVKDGPGTLRLTSPNTYAGPTYVNAGTLIVDGSIASSSMATVVEPGATLMGSGTVGDTYVAGTLAPGNSIESLGTGALVFSPTSTFDYELNSSVLAGDLVDSTGSLSIASGAGLALAELASGILSVGDKLTLISYNGTWNNGIFTGYADGATFTLGSNTWLMDYNDDTGGGNFSADQSGALGFVTITVVPEPAATLGLALLLSVALLRRRRHS